MGLGNPCYDRGEEDGYLHDPRPLQDQDPHEASHQGWSEDGIWPGDEGEGEARQDCCEGLPSCRTQVTDLRGISVWLHAVCPRDLIAVGIPQDRFGHLSALASGGCAHGQCMYTVKLCN